MSLEAMEDPARPQSFTTTAVVGTHAHRRALGEQGLKAPWTGRAPDPAAGLAALRHARHGTGERNGNRHFARSRRVGAWLRAGCGRPVARRRTDLRGAGAACRTGDVQQSSGKTEAEGGGLREAIVDATSSPSRAAPQHRGMARLATWRPGGRSRPAGRNSPDRETGDPAAAEIIPPVDARHVLSVTTRSVTASGGTAATRSVPLRGIFRLHILPARFGSRRARLARSRLVGREIEQISRFVLDLEIFPLSAPHRVLASVFRCACQNRPRSRSISAGLTRRGARAERHPHRIVRMFLQRLRLREEGRPTSPL